MRFSRHFGSSLLVLLLGWCPCLSQDSAVPPNSGIVTPTPNPYDAQFTMLRQKWPAASPAESAVLLHKIYELRDFVNNAASVMSFLQEAAVDARQDRLVRDEALHYVALMQVHSGQVSAAEGTIAKLGFVRDWLVAGPFPSGTGLDAVIVRPGHSPKSWRNAPLFGPNDALDLSNVFPASPGEVFAATSIFCEQSQIVAFRWTSNVAAALFVNGRQVSRADAGGLAFDQHVIGVGLQQGWNTVALKLHRGASASLGFALRITAPAGGSLGLKSSAQPLTNVAQRITVAPVQDLVSMAENAAAAEPRVPELLETLGALERLHGRVRALEHLDTAARMSPSAERWLEVASACGENACAFSALNNALGLEPQSREAALATADYYLKRGQLRKACDILTTAVAANPFDYVI